MTSAEDWLDALAQRELVTRRADTKFAGEAEYTFRHALVREAAYASLTDSDRKLGHKLAAEWLRAAGERDAMTLAEHFARGGEPEEAIGYFRDAAESALRGNDFAAALLRADRGIACGAAGATLGALYLVQAEAHRWVGAFADAERCGALALDHLPPRTVDWYVAAGELASSAGLVGNHERLVSLSAALRAPAVAAGAEGPAVIASARAAVQLLHMGKYQMAGELVDAVEKRATKETMSDPAVAGWMGRARTIMAGKAGLPSDGRVHAKQSAASLEAAGDLRTACLQRMNLGYYMNELGEYAEAEATLRAALADAARIGLHHVTAPGKSFLGYALIGLGRLAEAAAEEREAIELFAAQGDKRMEAASRNHLGRARLADGDGAAAIAEAKTSIALCEKVPSMRATSYATLAVALLAGGDGAGALEAASEGMRILESLGGIDQGEARLRLAYARAQELSGDRAAARAAIEEARERLEARAATIHEEDFRRSFLENVPENAETLALAREWDAVDDGDRPTILSS
jgi:tetratricopeptide (TPR) repeat protein